MSTASSEPSRTVEFGAGIPMWLLVNEAANGRHEQLAQVLQAMWDAGFRYFHSGDHIADVGLSHHEGEDRTRVIYGDVFSTLAFLAPLNDKLQFVVGVLILPLRHPVVVAHQAATLDRLTGGRFILGVGSGYARPEFAAVGVDFKDRFALTEESLQIVLSLLEEPTTSYEGRFYNLDDVALTCTPLTKPRPPIWVGGVGDKAALRAARLADGWYPSITGYERASGPTPRKLAEMNELVQSKREALGKPRLPVIASSALGFAFMTHPQPFQGPADVRERCVTGTGGPEHLAELIDAYHEAGVDRFIMPFHTQTSLDDCLRAIDVFANEVKPRLGTHE